MTDQACADARYDLRTGVPSLADAIEQLYSTFSVYPFDLDMGVHDRFEKQRDELQGQPLREVDGYALETFAFRTMTTWGGEFDFKHFLPRLLELEAHGGLDCIVEVRTKLNYGMWRSWPRNEQQAVTTYYQALAISRLLSGGRSLADVLIDTILLNIDMAPFVAAWTAIKDEPCTIRQLVSFCEPNGLWYYLDPWSSDPVGPHPTASEAGVRGEATWQQLRAWILSGQPEDVLTTAYLTGKAGETALLPAELDAIAKAADALAAHVKDLRSSQVRCAKL